MSHASAVESLLFAALEKATDAERAAFLDAACAGDAELRRQVEELLKAHARAGDFLQKPVVEQWAATPEPAHDPLQTTDHAAPPEPEEPSERGEAAIRQRVEGLVGGDDDSHVSTGPATFPGFLSRVAQSLSRSSGESCRRGWAARRRLLPGKLCLVLPGGSWGSSAFGPG